MDRRTATWLCAVMAVAACNERPAPFQEVTPTGTATALPRRPAARCRLLTPIIHMASSGCSDSNDGREVATAVCSLQRANELLTTCFPDKAYDARVVIEPGTYAKQRVVWTYVMPDHTVTIRGHDNGASTTIFDGCASPADCLPGESRWFMLDVGDGQATNVHIADLTVRRYWQAISFGNPSRSGRFVDTRTGKWNGSNEVRNCTFEDIGTYYNQTKREARSVITLWNSRANVIRGNAFRRIRSWCRERERPLHALYLIHDASDNLIVGNTFREVSGTTIKLNDGSNRNAIVSNTFSCAGFWRAPDKVAAADHYIPESRQCPSWGNVVVHNQIGANLEGVNLTLGGKAYNADLKSDCPPPAARARMYDGPQRNVVEYGCVALPPAVACAPERSVEPSDGPIRLRPPATAIPMPPRP